MQRRHVDVLGILVVDGNVQHGKAQEHGKDPIKDQLKQSWAVYRQVPRDGRVVRGFPKALPSPRHKRPTHPANAKIIEWVAHSRTRVGTRSPNGQVHGNGKLVAQQQHRKSSKDYIKQSVVPKEQHGKPKEEIRY